MSSLARYTLQELCHYKLIHLVMASFFGTFGIAYFIIQFTVGGHLKILMDYALFAYFLLTFFFPLLCVIPFINRHEHHKLWSFFLTKDISRSQLICKFWTSFTVCILFFGLLFYSASVIIIKLVANVWAWPLWPAFIVLALQGIFFVSCALFFALIAQPLIAQLATACVYCVCYTNHEWVAILHQNGSPTLAQISTLFYYLLPDLSLVDIKSEIIYQLPLNFSQILLSCLYITLFSSIFLLMTVWAFQKKIF